MKRLRDAFAAVLLFAATTHAAGLPVVFEIDDPRDGLYESAAVLLRQMHVEERVPVTFQVVPCGIGSRTSPYQCVNNTGFHDNWGDWMRANPDLIDVGQHGNNHTELLGDLSRSQQLDLLRRGLEEMQTWGMPDGSWNRGRPLSMAAPFASSNADTISVLEELDYEISVKNSGDCFGSSTLDVWCNSVPLCELNPQGGRVTGPSCVIKAPETMIQQVNARAGEGKVFIGYHAQDILRPDLQTVDPAKVDALRAVLQAFRDQEITGTFDLMTLDTHARLLAGVSTPGPGATATPAGPTPTPTPPLPTPTPLPAGTSLEIYGESLESPWIDASWSASVDYASSVRAFSGTRSIRVVQVGWGALSVRRGAWTATQPIGPAEYDLVELQVFPETQNMRVAVRLENQAGESFPRIDTGRAATGAWKKVSVSLDLLNPDGRSFDRISISNRNGRDVTYSVDELRLVRAGPSSTPTPAPPTATPAPPTPTPAPPTATPVEPTATPVQPTATPVEPTATPVEPTATPVEPTATPVEPTVTPVEPTATPTPAPQPDSLTIYEEALATPWINASWKASIDFDSSLRAFEGSRAIRVAQTGWGALSLRHGPWTTTQPLDPADFEGVEVMVFSETAGFNVSVRFENSAQQVFPEIATGFIPTNTWTPVFVPMSQLNPNGLPFDRVNVRNFNGTNVTYFVDNHRLVRR